MTVKLVDPQECVLSFLWLMSECCSCLVVEVFLFFSRSQFADQDEQTREDMKKEKRRCSLLFIFPQ